LRRVAITGVGPVTAIGVGRKAFEKAVRAGECGIAEITGFEVADEGPLLAAEVVDLDVRQYLHSTKSYLDRNTELALVACELAVHDAGLQLEKLERHRLGLCLGTEWANFHTLAAFHHVLAQKGPRLVPPFLFPHTYPNTTNSILSIEYGIQGLNLNFNGFHTSGAEAIAYAYEAILAGRADIVIAGGAEALCKELFDVYAASGLLSPREKAQPVQGTAPNNTMALSHDNTLAEGCRPFAPDRNGFVLGEGAALFVLESEASVRKRGALPLAWLAGAFRAGTDLAALRAALGLLPRETRPQAIFAAAAGSIAGDECEAKALLNVFAGHTPPVTAVKSFCGETLAAAGPIALAAAVATLAHGQVPPTHGSSTCAFSGLDLCLTARSIAGNGEARRHLFGSSSSCLFVHTADPAGAAITLAVQS